MDKRLEILNKYIDFSKDGVVEREQIVKAMQEYADLQLQQTGVKSSVFVDKDFEEHKKKLFDEFLECTRLPKQKIRIEFKEWDYTCGDGCCTSFGTKLLLNGKELEHPNEEIKDNSYVGDDTQTAIHAILKELGYEVKFGEHYF